VHSNQPLAGQTLDRLGYRIKEWDHDLKAYVRQLEQTKPVVVTGDLNVAHLDHVGRV
jgi:exonuclease III